MHRFSVKYVESVLGIRRSLIDAFKRAGLVKPARGVRQDYGFTFQEVVILRTGQHLLSSRIAPRKILQALRRLRQRLPVELPLTGLRITALGNDIAVREGPRWQSPSGQYLLDFEMTTVGEALPFKSKSPSASAQPADLSSAEDWFVRGCSSEERDPQQAKIAYRKCIDSDVEHCDAYLNLGQLLQEEGLHAEACALYQKAIAHCPAHPHLHYNLGIALEATQQSAAALASYASCIALDAAFADAHYNAARIHEKLGHAQQAIRHYSEYRRLQACR